MEDWIPDVLLAFGIWIFPKTGYDDMKYSGGLLGREQTPSSRSLFIFFIL
jgi:hypothetical protein